MARSDELILSMDQDANVISMAYVPLVSPLAPKTCNDMVDPPTTVAFDSKVSFELATPGMTLRTILPTNSKPPPGLRFFAKAKVQAATAGPGGAAEPEAITGPMGFFKRYWYIIVPLLLMNLFGPQAPEEEKGGGGAVEAATAGAAAAAGTVAGPAGNNASPGSKRRGKRG